MAYHSWRIFFHDPIRILRDPDQSRTSVLLVAHVNMDMIALTYLHQPIGLPNQDCFKTNRF